MALTPPPSAPPAAPTAAPDAPSRANPSTFRTLADAFLGWIPGFRNSLTSFRDWMAGYITWAGTHVTEMNALQTDVANKQAAAASSANDAGTSASNAASSASAAATSATAAAASKAGIDNRIYPGTYASDPTTRPDGSAIQKGDQYTTTAGVVKVYNSGTWAAVNLNMTSLAASGGSALVGDGSTTVADRLASINLADYSALRAYAGASKRVRVTGYLATSAPSGIAGDFVVDDSDTTSSDNGGTIIVASNGKRWKRSSSGMASAGWLGIAGSGADETTQFNSAESLARDLYFPDGTYNSGQDIFTAAAQFSSKALFKDTAGSNEFFAPVLRRKYADLTDAFKDKVKSAKSGAAPSIVCYGDSNTRYYTGDAATDGPYSKSYGAYIDLLCARHPNLYQATVTIKGYSGQPAEYGDTNFATNVPAGTDYLVLGFGTNNVKLASPDVEAYLASMGSMIAKALDQNTQPIVLGIPWFVGTYGSDGVQSQSRIRVWNSRLYRLCEDAGVPFIDTYSLTREFPSVYLNEATNQRHYTEKATRVIAFKIVEQINRLMSSTEQPGFYTESFHDLTWLKSHTGTYSRVQMAVGGRQFEVLQVDAGSSLTISGAGRGCIALYPKDAATVGYSTPYASGSITVTPALDNGEYYPIKRQALIFSHSGQKYDLTLTASSGAFYLRALSFAEGVMLADTYATSTFVEMAEASRPANGVLGRTYFFTGIGRPAWWSRAAGGYVGSEGLFVIGNTTTRNAVSSAGCPVGYKFWNTDTSSMQRWSGSAWA